MRFLLVLSLALLTPKLASACDCIQLNGPIIRPDSKAIVATGRVIDVQLPDEKGFISADIEITERFANATVGSHVKVYTHWSEAACGYPRLRQGEHYVVVTDYIEAKDIMWASLPIPSHIVGLCGGTRELSTPEGQKMLEAIREEMQRLRRK